MLELDPRLTFAPQQEVDRQFAQTVVLSATQLARSGEITTAVATYQEALRLDPTLLITPAIEANRNYASQLARSGEITAAVAAYQKVLRLDPTLQITPVVEANYQYASTVVDYARQLAQGGEITAAIIMYQYALVLDPSLAIIPTKEAQKQDHSALYDADNWDYICWNGTLAGLAAQVMVACENAVAVKPAIGNFRDSRALARALTGDIAGAIEDFEFFVKWAKQIGYDETSISSRQQYLADLKAGKNPFTPEVLQKLRNE